MIRNERDGHARRGRRALAWTMTVTMGALGACDSLLEVELPGQIVATSLDDPKQSATLVNSAIGDIECAYANFIATNASGPEDVYLRVTGWGFPFEYQETPSTASDCNPSDTAAGSWWSPLQAGRYVAELAYESISAWTDAEVGPARPRLLAQSAIYAGIAYNVLGDYFCEASVEEGPLMSPDQTLAKSEEWLTSALTHISASGDFAVPHGIATSASEMAHLLRARVRWARGDLTGAAADALEVSPGFKAYATRDAGGVRSRWNRVFESHNGNGWGTVIGPIDWWEGPGDWPAIIPFTGYHDLAVLPDGRAVLESGHAITTGSAADAVPDVRVPVRDENRLFNGFPKWTQQKYPSLDADVVLANWEEAWLIRAEIEGGQGAIDLVNEIRAHHGLPLVAYLSPGDAAGIRTMILEERRRSLFLEARWWATKLREDLWFPRGVGRTIYPYPYFYAVRMVMPDDEFNLNPNFDLDAQGSLCGDQAPANL